MDSLGTCQVDDCARRVAVSVFREDLPGLIRLCATHTEDFRLNGVRWTVIWGPGETTPTTVRPAPPPAVGRSALGPAVTPGSGRASRLKSRLRGWHQPRP